MLEELCSREFTAFTSSDMQSQNIHMLEPPKMFGIKIG